MERVASTVGPQGALRSPAIAWDRLRRLCMERSIGQGGAEALRIRPYSPLRALQARMLIASSATLRKSRVGVDGAHRDVHAGR